MCYDDLFALLPFSLVLFLGIAHTKNQIAKLGTGDADYGGDRAWWHTGHELGDWEERIWGIRVRGQRG